MQSFSDCSPVDNKHCQHEYNRTACHWNNFYRAEVKLTGRYIRSIKNIIIIKIYIERMQDYAKIMVHNYKSQNIIINYMPIASCLVSDSAGALHAIRFTHLYYRTEYNHYDSLSGLLTGQ